MKINKQPILLCPDINYVWGLSEGQNKLKTIGIIEINSDKFVLGVDTYIERYPNTTSYTFRALGRDYKPRFYKSREEAEKAWNDQKMAFHVCSLTGKYGLGIVIER